MKISEFGGSSLAKYKPVRAVIGLDIGSRAAKGVLLFNNDVYTTLIATGLYMQETADELLERLVQSASLSRSDVAFIVGTGYGRISLKYEDIPYRVVTEISCHAMGAHVLNPRTRTIIDIGGQDSNLHHGRRRPAAGRGGNQRAQYVYQGCGGARRAEGFCVVQVADAVH